MRKKDNLDDKVPHLIGTDIDSKELKQELEPFDSEGLQPGPANLSPKCSGRMKLLALMDDVDYSQLPVEELCLKHTSSGQKDLRSSLVSLCQKQG